MVPDLLEPTGEISGLCSAVVRDLHEVCRLILAEYGQVDGACSR
jgi:hypothetical protein